MKTTVPDADDSPMETSGLPKKLVEDLDDSPIETSGLPKKLVEDLEEYSDQSDTSSTETNKAGEVDGGISDENLGNAGLRRRRLKREGREQYILNGRIMETNKDNEASPVCSSDSRVTEDGSDMTFEGSLPDTIENHIISDEEQESDIREVEIEPSASVDQKEAVNAPQRREVYKMPDVDAANQNRLMFWPANLIILAVTWQLKVLFSGFSTIFAVFGFMFGLVKDPVQMTSDVKKQVNEFVNFQIRPVAADVGPKIGSFAKKVGWGVLAMTYVGVILGVLVIPVILVVCFFMTKLVEEPIDSRAPLYFNYTEPRPTAAVSLCSVIGPKGISKLVEEGPTKTKSCSWHKIHVTVTLTLPESDYNRQLGMFQVTAELLSARAEVLQRSTRPCMLRFQSAPIRYAKTLLYGLPVLLDVSGEYQKLQLDMIELTQHGTILLGNVRILIEPRAGFPPGGGLPEIYAGETHIRSELPWKKSLIYKWKWTIYVWTAIMLFFVEVAIVLCCFRQLLLPRGKKQREGKSRHDSGVKSARRSHSHAKKRVSFQET